MENDGSAGFSRLVAFFGMWLGRMVRDRLNTETFRKVVLLVLLVAGLNLIRRAVMG